jgi:hypothetical protein
MPHEDFLYFVSYARDDYYIAGSAGLEENPYLKDFFVDLREAVRIRSGRGQTDPVDYRDLRQIDLGKPWRGELLDGLQRSRCLLALCTPTFFNRIECGKEVRFLQLRVSERYAARAAPHSFVVPVIWTDPGNYPESLRELNYFYGAFPAEYKEYGLRVLAQVAKFADQYRQSVEAIAQQIDAVRRMDPLPKLATPPDLFTLESAFVPSGTADLRSNATAEPVGSRQKRHTSIRAFLCHASPDKEAVRKLYQRLRQDSILPWLDEEDLLAGQNWDLEIRREISRTDVVIVCISKSSLTRHGYVQKEIKEALDLADERPEGEIFLIPIRLEECELPSRLSRLHYVDIFAEGGYEKMLRALRERKTTP